MKREIIMPVLLSFGISLSLGPVLIPFLRKQKAEQTERETGVKSHLKKAGTPTMGGMIFLTAFAVTVLCFAGYDPAVIPILFLTLAFGLVGFLDDYLKVVLKRSDGLRPAAKLWLQILVTTIFLWYLIRFSRIPLLFKIPFFPGKELDMGIFTIPLFYFVILGTVNGVNFTDGLDGLAASVTVLDAVFFSVAAIGTGSGLFPVPLAAAGSLLGFLVFNVFPARVFMGDTGSLALGGFVAGTACFLRLPLFLPLVGMVYVIEILSVILQVSYFKMTHGKRIFKMTPVHHHFELMGWSETQIVAVFSIVTAIVCLIALIGL